jgi:pimeloyl-ACP methyl ester carboxylesterase
MVFEFNQITVDTDQYQLSLMGDPVPVEPQVFDLLVYLIKNRGRVVTRDELFEALWAGKVVTDAALGVRLKDVRKAIGDNGKKQTFIKTIHGRGYQFIAPISEQNFLIESITKPKTCYAQNGDVSIAYQVFGDGLQDLIVIPGWLSNLDLFWEQARAANFFRKLGEFCRVILIDRRGTGLSDRVAPPTLEVQMKDLVAVMEAVGCKRAAMLGYSEGGNISAQFVATYPRRTSALILIGTAARWIRSDEYQYGPTAEEADQWITEVENNWGGPIAIDTASPSLVDDSEYQEWLAKFYRSSASKTTALALLRMSHEIDLLPILPLIDRPTLVLQATGDLVCPFEAGRDLAQRIQNAKFVSIDTNDHIPFVGCPDEIAVEIMSFLDEVRNWI